MAFNLKDAVAAAKNKGPDMTKASAGGGDFERPVDGFTRLRFVGYIELGKRESEWQGKKKVNDTAELIFELSGPKHAPRDVDGQKYPHRVTVKQKISFNEKSKFFQLFQSMNWEGKATHIAELLGNEFVAEVKNVTKKGEGGKDFTYTNLENIRKPFGVNPETGDDYRVNVDQPITELKLFLWDFATPEMWDALFIEGEYEEKKDDKGVVIRPARSKNVLQEKITKALNFKASPIFDYASKKINLADVADLDEAIGDAEEATSAPEQDDPLADTV